MSKYIKVYGIGTAERDNLRRTADILNGLSPNGWFYHVGETYFDFGQDWKWTTIICEKTNGDSYQALNPVEHERIILADIDELPVIASDILSDKYCPDKIKS